MKRKPKETLAPAKFGDGLMNSVKRKQKMNSEKRTISRELLVAALSEFLNRFKSADRDFNGRPIQDIKIGDTNKDQVEIEILYSREEVEVYPV